MSKSDKNKNSGSGSFIDRIEGDKVVWIIVFLLTMISALTIFSSTSQLTGGSKDRIDLIREHGFFIIIGYLFIFVLYKIKSIEWFKKVSQIGFIVSFLLLFILDFKLNLGFVKAETINDATRTLNLLGILQIHVFEVVKVAMVMYLAWALSAYKQDQEKGGKTFGLVNWLSKKKRFKSLAAPGWKRFIYLYLPVILISVMCMPGSNSSMFFIGGLSLVILLIGRMPMKEILAIIGVGVVGIAILVGISTASDGKVLSSMRVSTLVSRLQADYSIDRLVEIEKDSLKGKGSKEWLEVRDKIKQPYTAKIAIHEGGLFGKGSGNSTQKYVVTHIYSDFMFSFIVEEYGLFGGIFVLILFVSLLARGSTIARLCPQEFEKMAVGGLSLMITAQAFMHIFVNVGIGPMTGQTLPLISDGSFAFLMFSIAFGIILSISRLVRKQIKQEEEQAQPIYENPLIEQSTKGSREDIEAEETENEKE